MGWFKANPANGILFVTLAGELGIGTQRVSDFEHAVRHASIVDLRIDSVGGSSAVGLQLYDILKACPSVRVTVHRAYSSAVLPMLAGSQIVAYDSSSIMLHPVTDFVAGTAEDLRNCADALETIRERTIEILVKRTKRPVETIRLWLSGEDVYFPGKQACEAGLVDSVEPAPAPGWGLGVYPTTGACALAAATEAEQVFNTFLGAFGILEVADREGFLRRLHEWSVTQVKQKL